MRRHLSDCLENKPFPKLSDDFQKKCFFEFGSIEDHFKYRDNVMKSYSNAHFPIFDNYNHMQYQIKNPKCFSYMLLSIIENNEMPAMDFLK